MLSAESAAGRYPLESVTMQQLVINKVETDEVFRRSLDRFALENMQRDKHQQHSNAAGKKNDVGGMMASTAAAISLAARQVRFTLFSPFLVSLSAFCDLCWPNVHHDSVWKQASCLFSYFLNLLPITGGGDFKLQSDRGLHQHR